MYSHKLGTLFLYILVGLFSLVLYSCFGATEIAKYIEKNAPQLSEENINILNTVQSQQLRQAKDTKNGALYYAGLLWFLNEDTKNAEIAWKRAARTATSPWKEEALRLVAYQLTRESRYNQVSAFVNEIITPKNIMKDAEIFSYYARALWSEKDYSSLKALLEHPANFSPTIRNRITIAQAHFNYDMWKSLIRIMNDTQNTEHILQSLLLAHRVQFTDPKLITYLASIGAPPVSALSLPLQQLLHLNTARLSAEKRYDILIELPNNYYQSPAIVLDLMSASKNASFSHIRGAINTLRSIDTKEFSSINKAILILAEAELLYRQDLYKESVRMYAKVINSPDLQSYDYATDTLAIADFLYVSQWRYLFNIIYTNPQEFSSTFVSFINNTDNPEYFSNLLEEYLSYLLRTKSYSLLNDDYIVLSDALTHGSLQLELVRWESILTRLNTNIPIDLSRLYTTTTFHSDFPFDYLINYHDKLTAEQFINDWIHPVETEELNSDVDTLIQGFLKYGLITYGYAVALENTSRLNALSVEKMSEALYKNGNITQALTLTRKAIAENKQILKNQKIFKLLYPIPYLDIVETITTNPIEISLMMGVMREESSFDHDVRSHAHAVGLTQLLMPTAQDIAERIEYQKPIRLTDPEVNITLGYHYMKYLIRVLGSPLKAIVSYNGGLGNVWKWEDAYNTDNLIVFADSLPIRETRNYIRKVASSAMIYGMLYFNMTPEEFKKYLLSEF